MEADKKGGDRQELHERLRTHSIAAGKVVKEEGGENDLIDRVCADPAFMLSHDEIDSILVPENFTGRSAEQVTIFLNTCVRPIEEANREILGENAELSV